jgi:hypothetical protein
VNSGNSGKSHAKIGRTYDMKRAFLRVVDVKPFERNELIIATLWRILSIDFLILAPNPSFEENT